MEIETRKTAAYYRAAADAYRARRKESFERCDTDGFLSQWADDLGAQLADRKAEIAEAGFVADFTGLYQGDRRVRAKMIEGRFGFQWLLHEGEAALIAARGGRYLPTGENSRVLKALGLAERSETAPAWAKIAGKGYGLSGRVWVATFRSGDDWGQDAQLQ